MDRGVISKGDVPRLARELRFYAPGARGAHSAPGAEGTTPRWTCELEENPSRIAWDFANVRTSLKALFLPQTETLCTFDFDEVREVPLTAEPTLVFGCRPCDARAMAQLDVVFGPANKGPGDPYWRKRRENTVVVSLACARPCSTCFCTATGGSPSGTQGADLIAHELEPGAGAGGEEGRLLLEALNDKGRAFLQSRGELLSAPDGETLQRVAAARAAAEAAVRRVNDLGVDLGADIRALKRGMDPLFEDERWEGLTASCIGCGACTYLCPTCHCFDIADETRLYEGRRIRTWDSCQFPLFTKHASGHNPRTNKRQRLRQRFMHKFSYAVENNEQVLCVGCGRCIDACPVNLDIREVIHRFAQEGNRDAVR